MASRACAYSHFLMVMARTIILFFFSLFLFCSDALVSPGSSSNATADELALLSFKSMFASDGSLASWNKSIHYCSWPGVVCSRRHPERVISLRLGSSRLSGLLSPFLGNLSFLKILDLHDNRLVGSIPPELGRLSRLRLLNLSTNSLQGNIPVALVGCTNLSLLHLSDNQFQGEFPTEIGASLKNLVLLNVEKNGFSGEIPRSLADLPLLEELNLRVNRFSGEIPPALGNLTNLWILGLDYNRLSGAIPSSLGKMSGLSRLTLSSNNLTGLIPSSIWNNMSALMAFTVQQNSLSGTIPPNAFSNFPSLQLIGMDHNKFHGSIPTSIANASHLWLVQLGANFLSGIVPPEIGGLRNLKILQLSETFLEARSPNDWKFITALTNCSQFSVLYLASCSFGGVLPDSLSNLSSLTNLFLDTNKISGSIPEDIDNLINLQAFNLDNNNFTGHLPSSIGRLQNLHLLSIGNNKIGGPIPLTLGNLTELYILQLRSNAFSGSIPSIFRNLTNLLGLSLDSNNFTGQIPTEVVSIVSLSEGLNLSNNNLEGSIPQQIGNLKNLVNLDARSNKLSGEIPTTLGECQLLQNIYLQNNMLTGSLPSLLSQLKGLQTLDLSSNNLSGQIPTFLSNLTMLGYLNLSFNDFVGEVPTLGVFLNASAISIQGNGKLCGGVPDLHLPRCTSQSPHRRQKFLLARATDSFSATNLLGSGSFGSVYKGELDKQSGQSKDIIAVKVLKLQTPGALKSFTAECEALRNLRHRNLVKIITACSSIDNSGNDFKAIVFDFMPSGNLEGWLHPATNNPKYLNLLQRVGILLDVANALDYLHCHGPTPVVHCDLKPSNVLLDAEMVAHVGDFGLAKILFEGNSLLQQSTSSMGLRGTIGYAPPEYGAGNTVSTQGDIYSYGILVLETVTGKRPTDKKFIQGLSLREYVELGLHGKMMDVVDTQLSLHLENELRTTDEYKVMIDCLVSLLRLGLYCSQEIPSNRMSTGDIIKELNAIKQTLLSPTSVMISSLLLLLLIGPASSDDDAAAAARTSTGGVAGDELALLSFKSSLLHQGGLSLASWNTSGHGQHCTWVGVVCGRRRRRRPHRVVKLLLRSSNLSGIISPSLGNLSFLRELDLSDNYLSGEIPPELSRLSRLQLLELSGNSIQGSIPAAIGACTKLTSLDLSHNQLRLVPA
uniref:Receptor kinase-like protein Xa21 n=1 Tax=Oryza nivara TaxID=4536 RepID=A0A0E0GYM3_ORYNI